MIFQYCLNPYSSDKFLYFRGIQRHSGGNFVDPLLQDNVLLPDDLAEYIHHIGNAFAMHSIIRRDRQSVFFTAVNPMDARQDLKEVEYDLDTPRIAPCKQNWRAHHNTACWCNFKACSEKGIAILSNSIACSYSFKHTTSDLKRESDMHENW